MKPSKSNTAANITLKNISEAELSGPRLLLSKLKNELFNRKKSDIELKRASVKPKKKYRRILSVIICTAERNSIALNAINSVINQDFSSEKYEIIVVNNSREKFCGEPSGRNIKIVNEPTQGLSRARNTGADSASGEYLLYIDDDALARENLLLNMFKAFEKHPGCAIIGGQIFLELPSPAPNVFLKGREALWSGYTVPYKNSKRWANSMNFPTVRVSEYDIPHLTASADSRKLWPMRQRLCGRRGNGALLYGEKQPAQNRNRAECGGAARCDCR